MQHFQLHLVIFTTFRGDVMRLDAKAADLMFVKHSRILISLHRVGVVQKVFSEKASAIARMRQKCVRNASKWVFFHWGKRGTFQNASEMRQKCVKNASKMRRTPLGENTFWTIPIEMRKSGKREIHPAAHGRSQTARKELGP